MTNHFKIHWQTDPKPEMENSNGKIIWGMRTHGTYILHSMTADDIGDGGVNISICSCQLGSWFQKKTWAKSNNFCGTVCECNILKQQRLQQTKKPNLRTMQKSRPCISQWACVKAEFYRDWQQSRCGNWKETNLTTEEALDLVFSSLFAFNWGGDSKQSQDISWSSIKHLYCFSSKSHPSSTTFAIGRQYPIFAFD